MKQFTFRCTYQDRRLGPGEGRSIVVSASNLPGAVGKAARGFWSMLNRKQRLDAAKTLKVEIRNVEQIKAAQ